MFFQQVCPANWQPGDKTMNPDPVASKAYFSTVADVGKAVAGGATIEAISDSEKFNAAIAGPGLTVVDYWAPWCRNCKKIEPSVARLASEISGAKFITVNTVEAEAIGAVNGVDALPTFQFFKAGAKVGEFKGSDVAALEAAIKAAL